MRGACLYTNWSFVPIFLKIYRALMRWTPWSFFWEVAVMSHHDGGTYLEWGVGGRGIRALSQILSDEILFIKTHSYGGALTSDFMEEHSSPTSIFPVSMMRSSKWKHVPRHWLLWGNSPVTAGNSPVTGKFPSHRPVTRSFDGFFICAWTNGWVNNQDVGDVRRHRAHYDVTVMWCRIVIQWSWGVQRVTLVQFWIGETGQIGGFRALWKEWLQIWHTALPWLPFLEISYILHSAAV